MSDAPMKKSGLAVLVGRSNVGKSTLINTLVGTKVAITSPKPQTTRHLIQGVVNDERGQVVFVDTPGIFKQVPDRLTAKLNEKAKESMEGIDCLVYVVDPTRYVGDEEKAVKRMVLASSLPKILVINKSDRRGEFKEEYLAWSDEFNHVIEVSALHVKGIKQLLDVIFELLPEGEPLYPEDRITDVENRFWLAEVIREKVFLKTHQEIPFGVTVEIEEIEERENGVVYVQASVLTRDSRHKKMIIGHGAQKIKAIGQAARHEIEMVTERRIFLDLDVRVDEKWEERFV